MRLCNSYALLCHVTVCTLWTTCTTCVITEYIFCFIVQLHYITQHLSKQLSYFILLFHGTHDLGATLCVLLVRRFLCASVYLGVYEQSIFAKRFTTIVKSQSHNMMTQEKESFIFEPFLNRGQLTIVCSTTCDTFLVVIDPSVYLSQLRCTFVDFDTSFCRFKSSSFCQLCKVIFTESGFLQGRCWCSCAHQTKSESALSAAGSLSDT